MYADIVILLILVVALALGVKRGVLAGLLGIASVIAAYLGAAVAAERLTPAVEQWIRPVLMRKLVNTDQADGNALLQALGYDGQMLQRLLNGALQQMKDTGETLLDAVVGNAAYSMAYTIVYAVSFFVLLAIFRILTRLLQKTDLPVLSQLDSICGGLLGLAEGVVLVFVAVWVMQRMNWILTDKMVSESVVLRFFVDNSIIDLLSAWKEAIGVNGGSPIK